MKQVNGLITILNEEDSLLKIGHIQRNEMRNDLKEYHLEPWMKIRNTISSGKKYYVKELNMMFPLEQIIDEYDLELVAIDEHLPDDMDQIILSLATAIEGYNKIIKAEYGIRMSYGCNILLQLQDTKERIQVLPAKMDFFKRFTFIKD